MRISPRPQVLVKNKASRPRRKARVVFPNGIALLRRAKGVSQGTLAEKLGVKPRQLRRIEAGELDLPVSRVLLIADFLNVSLDALCRRKRRDE